MLTAGDVVEKDIRMKDFVFSTECIYGVNEIWRQHASLWPSPWREGMCSRANLVSVFHRHLICTEVGIIIFIPDSGGDCISMSNRATCFSNFLSENMLVGVRSQLKLILMLQVRMCLSSLLTSEQMSVCLVSHQDLC